VETKNLILSILKYTAFALLGGAILYYVYVKQSADYVLQSTTLCVKEGGAPEHCQGLADSGKFNLLEKIGNDFKSTNPFWIILVIVAFVISNIVRALRWDMLFEAMGYKVKTANTFWTTMLGYFVNTALPRVGEVTRPVALSRYEKIPLDKVMGTIVVDRALDVLCLLFMIILAFVLEFDKLWAFFHTQTSENSFWSNPLVWAILVFVGFAGLFGLYLMRNQIKKIGLYKKIEGIVSGFMEGIRAVKKTRHIGEFVTYTVLIWVIYYSMMYLCFLSFAPTAHLTLLAALVVFVFSAFGILIPTPGGVGAYQWLVTLALVTFYGVNNADAFSYSNIMFFAVTLSNITIGAIGYIVLPIINKGYKPAHLEQ
jgi:glycosyltransferase 2 family protein